MLNKTLLGSAAVIMTMVGAQAADLPSKKAAPATYVKICDAYGAGFFFIPGTDTCVKLGGYVRAEYQYTPGKDVYAVVPNSFTAASISVSSTASGNTATGVSGYNFKDTAKTYTGSSVGIVQNAKAQSETGMEMRGRIDVDARSSTSMGTARTFVRLRAANTSGIRNSAPNNNGIYTDAAASTTGISIESAFVQWAGFTFGVAPENYAMMPSVFYGGSPWAGFPNGMKQVAYTATLGGGFSATLAIEDKSDFGFSSGPGNGVYLNRPATAANIVGNVRLDQSWGFAAVHGMIGNNSLTDMYGNNTNVTSANMGSGPAGGTTSLVGAAPLGFGNAYASTLTGVPSVITSTSGYFGQISPGQSTFGGWAVGGTVNFKLPMIAAGDQLWITANYAHGMLGALGSAGGLNAIATASQKRMNGGILRVDQNLMLTGGSGTATNPFTVGTVNGWNVAAAFTHYWAAQWRSNFSTGYVEINPPTSTAFAYDTSTGGMGAYALPQWGKGTMWMLGGSLVYSPAKDFDIGLELQYASVKNRIQNTAGAVYSGTNGGSATAVSTSNTALVVPDSALKSSNFTTKLRVERSF